ncbi:MAG: AzlD domain-containing protein [Pseudorhodoplanes sp.]|nr:AzlD domain-containing protein [Pseudorhodoplanes sp.]
MTATLNDINPYLALVLVGFLPNEVWRWLGLLFSRGLDEDAELVVWVKAVATAILAAVVAQLIFAPPGALAAVPLAVRLGATATGFLTFLLIRRSVFAGVVAGEIALVAGALTFGPG